MNASGNDDRLIVNCIPVGQEDRQRFLDAAGDVAIAFAGDFDHYGDMKVQAQIPVALRSRATAVIGNFDPEIASELPRLEWLQTWSAGVDKYLKPGVLPETVKVTSATGAYGQSVGEHMFAMTLALMKNLAQYARADAAHQWRDAGEVTSPEGATALILGTGDIGSHYATLVKAVGMKTIGVRRDAGKPAEGIDRMYGFDDLDELLPDADVVALSLPSTPQTRHILDSPRLESLKPETIIINGGRGDAIDLDALAESLDSGAVRAAGLDVTEPEPLPEDSPLWDEPRCLITPHVAGGSHLSVTDSRVIDIALANVRRYAAGEPVVDNAHR
ncbi:Phosphoglycerate dehydrogenase [Bifidobacterium bohemicum]|uniref:Phosphoglycerate dehydrogenase n=1 Tax=Bifidobacterium bohemicum DSM 22767 TaxID=1437606 RepID=A0A086ZJ43_9BIFI|nr:D-2-hydroxyacid dehydrogenase [Bifidobacterium bohemicum]KFI46543.1 phosphoglycerate dehydrogenase [Bifidobacterium bohemicum DSM 22767]SCB74629.1 Phosphoglycerate dehydrogenase [Bifidobacterium bohemicum]